MLPARTPELVELLTPALNAARNAAQTMESARDTGDRADREFAFEVRGKYESLRDDVLKKAGYVLNSQPIPFCGRGDRIRRYFCHRPTARHVGNSYTPICGAAARGR